MTILKRGMIIDVNLDLTQGSETGKVRPCIIVNNRMVKIRGKLSQPKIQEINQALKIIFELNL